MILKEVCAAESTAKFREILNNSSQCACCHARNVIKFDSI